MKKGIETVQFSEKHAELVGKLEHLRREADVARTNVDRSASLARAERGFTLLETTPNPFAGAGEVHAAASARVATLVREIVDVEEDIAALKLASAFAEHRAATRQLESQNGAAAEVSEKISALDPELKRSDRNVARFDARFKGVDECQRIHREIAEEERRENAQRQELIKQQEQMGQVARALSSTIRGIVLEFPEIDILLTAASPAAK